MPSRRLGKSLGINNILAPKVCSYRCVYCQVGKTAIHTTERQLFFTPEAIYEDVKKQLVKLSPENYPDYLTFVSNGEPTLDKNLGETIKLLKGLNIPVAVITNSSLVFNKAVRDELQHADWVSLKIDAGDKDTWEKINHPVSSLSFEKMVMSLKLFADDFRGTLCTETMLVNGLNDTFKNITNVSELIRRLNPGKAYLAVPIRPPYGKSVKKPEPERLNMAWQIFNDLNICTEFLTGFEGNVTAFTGNIYEDILNTTAVHPLREDSLMNLLENDNADSQVVKSLISQRLIRVVTYNGYKYYMREYHLNMNK